MFTTIEQTVQLLEKMYQRCVEHRTSISNISVTLALFHNFDIMPSIQALAQFVEFKNAYSENSGNEMLPGARET